MTQQQNKVQWIYSSQNEAELEQRYDQWAKDYDQDLGQDFGWIGPQIAANILARFVQPDRRILDAGAGTGLVGEVLAQQGFHNLVAMDLSRGMLEEARRKKVYQQLHQMKLGGPLDFSTGEFDAVISVGVLTLGHAPASSLDELVRITKPGGYITFTLRPDIYETGGFKEQQQALEAQGAWKLVEASEQFQPLPKGEPDVYHQVWVYQVTR